MLANLELHIIQFPSGCWGYVGSIPMALGQIVKATRSDVMGGRAWRNPNGDMVTVKFPTFTTEAQAHAHVKECNDALQ